MTDKQDKDKQAPRIVTWAPFIARRNPLYNNMSYTPQSEIELRQAENMSEKIETADRVRNEGIPNVYNKS